MLAAEKEKAAQEERERKAQEEKKKEEERKKAEAEARAEEQKLKDEIFDILICSTSYEGMTATEITKNLWPSNQSYSGAPDPILCNKVISALKKLHDEGQVSVSVINGRPYFRIN